MGGDGQDFINGGAQRQRDVRRPRRRLRHRRRRAPTRSSATAATTGSRAAPARTCSRATTARRSSTTPAEFEPGNDVFIGQAGENDYDTEGGDDIMSQNAAIDRNAGAGGFDWAIHQYDTVGADDDMKINSSLAGLPTAGRRQPRPLAGDRGRLGLARSTTSSGATTSSGSSAGRVHGLRRARRRRRRPHRRPERCDDVPDRSRTSSQWRRSAGARSRRGNSARGGRLGRGQHPPRRWRQRHRSRVAARRHHRRRPSLTSGSASA